MAAKDRNNPTRQASSASDYSLMEFTAEYPDDAACLDRLWRDRFAPDGHTADCPKCEKPRRFHRTKTRASYTCDSCGLHIHPMKGTIFQKSTTSLRQWFSAMYLMAGTRCGSRPSSSNAAGGWIQNGAPDDAEDPHRADD